MGAIDLKGTTMTSRLARILLIVVALLALAGGNVFAAPVTCATGSLASYIGLNATGGCTIGDKTFANFADLFISGEFSGNQTSPGTPNDALITVYPVTNDSANPNTIGLYMDFHNTVNGVAYDQTLSLDVNYTVTVGTGWNVTSVYTAAAGGIAPGMTTASVFAVKDLCVGGTFVINVLLNTDTCTGTLVTPVTGQDQFTLGNYAATSSGTIPLGSAQTVLNVSDEINLYGGTVNNGGGTAAIYSMANEFNQTASGVPEPGTCLLLGSALLGLGALWRKRV
jgi:hypothetical protein